MPGPSPFAADWRDCLVAHYQNVLRHEDYRTEGTLLGVLQEVGFSEHELAEFKVLATLRADGVGPDFVPDLDALKAEAVEAIQQQMAASLPAQQPPELTTFASDDLEVVSNIEEDSGALAVAAAKQAPVDADSSALPPDEEPPDYRASGPEQLSMF